ncbi:MAG: hypothetical protein FWG17_02575 [Desulfovibrionaceae bacterium]|nr:hypothetical protein [Desulfovibrionaceae bacterium]
MKQVIHDCPVSSFLKDPRVCLVFFILFAQLSLSGCSLTSGLDRRVEFDLTSKAAIYVDSEVIREPPLIHVHPVSEVGGLKVLFMPFQMTQSTDHPEMVGYSLSRAFWQTWSSMRVFEQFEFVPDGGPFRRDMAVAYAKARGADLVIGGFVTYLLAGGTTGPSSLGVQIEGYDVSSGLLVWSMAQAGALPARRARDYIVLEVKNRLPSDPLYVIAGSLASDMGQLMRAWASSDASRTRENPLASAQP